MRTVGFAGLFAACIGATLATDAPPLKLSHGWIVVATGARERTALRPDGQPP
jgi:hypothetical protein